MSGSSVSTGGPIGSELAPGTRLGEYVIEERLGIGGFGITYLASGANIGKKVVIKENMPGALAVRDPSSNWVRPNGREVEASFDWALKRFIKEARLLAGLQHPNIVRVYEAFSALGTAYYVMPWVGGKDLGKAAPAPGEITELWLSPLLSTLLETLSYLHGQNLLHRDIKPNNILMQEDGTPVFIDFGAAKSIVAECGDAATAERSSVMMVAHGYTPIEQLQAGGKLGPWSDIYALGATCYKLIMGSLPPDSISRATEQDPCPQLHKNPELLQRFSRSFLKGIDKALAPRAVNRWQTAEAWRQAIPPLPLPTMQREIPPSSSGSGVLPWVLAGVFGCGLIAAVPYHFISLKNSLRDTHIVYTGSQPTEQSSELSDLRAELQRVKTQLTSTEGQLRSTERQLRDAQSKAASRETSSSAPKENSSALQNQLSAARSEVQRIRESLRSTQSQLEDYKTSLANNTLSSSQAMAALRERGLSATGTALYEAARHGNAANLRLLIAAGVDVNSTGGTQDWPALIMAAYYGHTECVEMLLKAPGIDVNKTERAETRGTAFYWAVRMGRYDCQMLLQSDKRVNVNAEGDGSPHPLIVAVGKKDPLAVAMLLEHQSIWSENGRGRIKDKQGRTPLQIAKSLNFRAGEALLGSSS